jgi:hypothetical protein
MARLHTCKCLSEFISPYSLLFFLPLFILSVLHFFSFFIFFEEGNKEKSRLIPLNNFPTLPSASSSYFRFTAVRIYIFPIYFLFLLLL